MLDTWAFYDNAQQYATPEGLQEAAEAVRAAEGRVKDTQAAVDECQARIVSLMGRRGAFDGLHASVKEKLETEDRQNLDSFIANGDTSAYADFAAERQARLAELSLLAAAGERISRTLIPSTSIERLRAEVAHQDSVVTLSEASARLLIARKLLLLQPLLQAEGESIQIAGGASDGAITAVIQARELLAQKQAVLEQASELFRQSQEKLPTY